MRCDICNSKIEEGILKKIIGTTVKNSKGKKKTICNSCQKKLSIEEIKEKLE